MLGRDAFVGLPTGSGKSLCYATPAFVFDIRRARAGPVVVVVCPLQSIIIEDQVSKYRARSAGDFCRQKDKAVHEGGSIYSEG